MKAEYFIIFDLVFSHYKYAIMKKFLIWGTLLLVIFLSIMIFWKYFFTYSEGYRAGLLQKFSHRGNLFKTYEGEMILSSIQSNKNVQLASEKFFFSVDVGRIATTLEGLEGSMVVVHYHQKNGTLPWRGETEYLVDSVRVVQ
jgi:hypothetical protein